MNSAADLHKGGVSPFGHPRINDRSHLPAAFRSVPRPSSPLGAKASTERPSFTQIRPPPARRTNTPNLASPSASKPSAPTRMSNQTSRHHALSQQPPKHQPPRAASQQHNKQPAPQEPLITFHLQLSMNTRNRRAQVTPAARPCFPKTMRQRWEQALARSTTPPKPWAR